jgi:hypothetical protein
MAAKYFELVPDDSTMVNWSALWLVVQSLNFVPNGGPML